MLADTFQMHEDGDVDDLQVFPENNQRLTKQRDLDIRVIVGNPPYSSGQDSANDNNQNAIYPALDKRIRTTYSAGRNRGGNNSLYDSYIRAIRWASDRVKDRGVIAFVTNGGFLDANVSAGLRRTLADEFSKIYVYNLRGNQRTAGEQSRREGGKVFDAGSRATVAITVLVKNPAATGPGQIHYRDIGDYLTRQDKLRIIRETGSIEHLNLTTLTPNAAYDWLNQRNDGYGKFIPIGSKHTPEGTPEPAIFARYSRGLETGRDAWIYNFSADSLRRNVEATVQAYNDQVQAFARLVSEKSTTKPRLLVEDFIDLDPTRISWTLSLKNRLGSQRALQDEDSHFTTGCYRAFTKESAYFDTGLNHIRGQIPRMFPTRRHPNYGFYYVGAGSAVPFSVLMIDTIPDLHVTGAGSGGQFFSRHTYEAIDDDGALFGVAKGEVIDGYRRIDNITDEALARFHTAYGPSITKDDVFFYVYGLLHCPDYRTQFAADLKKMLPRIPLVTKAIPFIEAGRALSKLHLGYESVQPYQLDGLGGGPVEAGDSAYLHFQVERMHFGKPATEQKQAGLRDDRSTIVYNDRITLRGVPEEAYRYMLGSRSAIEWIMERYQVKVDKASQIRNDPNDWSREVGNPRYILDLLARIVTLSLETMTIVDALPPLDIPAPEGIV